MSLLDGGLEKNVQGNSSGGLSGSIRAFHAGTENYRDKLQSWYPVSQPRRSVITGMIITINNNSRAETCSGNDTFECERYSVQVSFGLLGILTEVFRCLPQSVQANTEAELLH